MTKNRSTPKLENSQTDDGRTKFSQFLRKVEPIAKITQIVFLSPPWLFEQPNSRFQCSTLHVEVHGLKKAQLSIATSSEDTADFLKHMSRGLTGARIKSYPKPCRLGRFDEYLYLQSISCFQFLN